MDISKEDLLRINRGFGGNLRSESSIDFAFNKIRDSKIGDYKQLAYLLRAILIDHPFSDGNKRTAMFLVFAFAKENDRQVDRDLLIHHLTSIAKKNIQEIRNIEWRLKNAIK
ncbi:MAG: Fic family protein [Nanoarchaeota archaeon]|nr:Fic family protein [Nanoarchaeota archaeon]